ncbi:helix-turn-helix domain-containing protein [Flavobacterium sp. MAHUQ-51]|uniref:helix-turn-helix domain-containing protein n=1 Tax=Flavobacterium sp. GCM10022190 TaxID=3252639 RepID=UPI00361BD431
MSSNIKITRICEFCNNEFTARTTKTRFCSLKCSSKNYKSKVKQAKISASNKETEIKKNPLLEVIKSKDFLSVNQASELLGISKRTIYRIIARGELDIAKFGSRTVIRRSDLDTFFSLPLDQSILRPVQEFPGLENCYTITQIQQKFGISSGALYMLIQRHSISKYAVGKFNYVAKRDIDLIFNTKSHGKE